MDQNKEEIRYILQYHFHKGDNAFQTCKKNFGFYGEGALSKSAARKGLCPGNFDVKDKPRSGGPITEKVMKLSKKLGKTGI